MRWAAIQRGIEMRSMNGHKHTTGGHEACTVMFFRTTADDALQRRVRAEFSEMPGLRLTLEQAVRLWGVDRQVCGGLLNALVASHFLEIDAYGRYRKAHGGY